MCICRPIGRQEAVCHLQDERPSCSPHASFLERPGVRHRSVTRAVAQSRLAELAGGPRIDLLQPGEDHPEVQEAAEAELGGQVRVDVRGERVLIGKYARELEEDTRHPQPWVAEERSEWTEPSERHAWRGDEGVCLLHSRLSIIDLTGGGQPMVSGCGRYVIVFNGTDPLPVYRGDSVQYVLELQ